MDKIKDLKLPLSFIKSNNFKVWFLAVLLLTVTFVMVMNISSYAHTKTINPIHPKVLHLTTSVSLTPTFTPTLTPTPQPPTPVPVVNNNSDYLLGKVNEYRRSLGLYEVKSDSNTCNFAKKRAQELTSNFNHDGFKNLPYPSYSKVTENIAMNENKTDVVNQWISSAGHAENMRADTPFVCIENLGNYYAYEGWKP